ncbi:MAG: hypothetical protein P4L82_00440 [Ancalomicrobiaceae bacterium]|nr:hypothetical protein [Ancalomicrobiaceae bacterium]
MPAPNAPLYPFTESGRLVGARLTQFATGSAELLPAHKDWIDKYFIPKMRANPNAWIDLIGSASRTGNAAKNLDLSGRRIDAVANYITTKYPGMRINLKIKQGDTDAASFKIEAANNDGFWRAVLIRWYGVQLAPSEVPDYPPEPEEKLHFRTYKAPPGCWCVISVNTFGLPIKAGIAAGMLEMTLLNDLGEQWVIKAYGGGIGVGPNIGPEVAEEGWMIVVKALKEIGLKATDLSNVSKTIKDLNLTGPSDTCGGVFRRMTWKAGLTIDQICSERWVTIGSGEAHAIAMGAEIGLVYFGAVLTTATGDAKIPLPNIAGPLAVVPELVLGRPWGYYQSLGLGTLKAALGLSCTQYRITSYAKAT